MGVDLATYRARIGSFVSRRNITRGDEKLRSVNVKRRWRRKENVCTVSDRGCYQDNPQYVIATMTLWELYSQSEKWFINLDVHVCANVELDDKLQSRSNEVRVFKHIFDRLVH